MRGWISVLPIALAGAASCAAAAAQPATGSPIFGVWWNHHQNVKVETRPCGQYLCGSVVWATPEAVKEAREAGTDPLIGRQLLSGYSKTPSGVWEGQVFVPDLKRTFFSRIQQVGPNELRIGGCILGGLFCKYKAWTRTDAP